MAAALSRVRPDPFIALHKSDVWQKFRKVMEVTFPLLETPLPTIPEGALSRREFMRSDCQNLAAALGTLFCSREWQALSPSESPSEWSAQGEELLKVAVDPREDYPLSGRKFDALKRQIADLCRSTLNKAVRYTPGK